METNSEKGQTLVELVIILFLLAGVLFINLPPAFLKFQKQIESVSLTKEVKR